MLLLLLNLAVCVEAFSTFAPGVLSHRPAAFSPTSRSFHPQLLSLKGGMAQQETAISEPAVPATFRALMADAVGSSFRDVAKVKEVPMQMPGEGEALIQVKYAGINGGCETFRTRGEEGFESNKDLTDPFKLGAEGVGVVVRTGPGVENVIPGDNVLFIGGAFAEYSVVNAAMLVKVKEASKEAVGLRVSGLTGWGAVVSGGQAKKRQVVLVTAGAGAAGSFAVQFAKKAGCEVVATTSTKEKAAALCKLGCDHIINYKTQDVNEALKSKFPGGVDLVIEHVGGKMLETAINNCKKGAKVIIVGYISQYPHNPESERDGTMLDLSKLMWKRGVQDVNGVTVSGAIYDNMDDMRRGGKLVVEEYERGELASLVDEREFTGLDSIPDAIDHMLSGKTIGKVVVEI